MTSATPTQAQVQLLRAKLHHARVTGADINYVGSISVDSELLDQTGILPWERVQVADVENGNRFETYVLPAAAGSGIIQLNGAAAHLVKVGDRIIVFAYALVTLPLAAPWVPQVVLLDEHNRIASWAWGEPRQSPVEVS